MKSNDSFILKIISSKTTKRLDKKNKYLGNLSNENIIKFLKIRLIVILISMLLIGILINNGFIYGPFIGILIYILSEYIVFDKAINKRKNKLDQEALFFFEALSLTLESGITIKKALSITCENIDNELSKEFSKVLKEIEVGKTFNEALNNLKERIPSDNINTVILNLIQSSKFGTDIMNSLHEQIDYLRDKRYLEIKGNISKLPIKLSIISVIIYIPLIMLLILSPLLLSLFD